MDAEPRATAAANSAATRRQKATSSGSGAKRRLAAATWARVDAELALEADLAGDHAVGLEAGGIAHREKRPVDGAGAARRPRVHDQAGARVEQFRPLGRPAKRGQLEIAREVAAAEAYIDLYQAHWDDRETPLDETLRAFDDLVGQGKVRYLGASNYQAWRLTRALWESDKRGYVRYESLQPKYNLVFRDEYERELEPLCLEQGVGVIPYSSLGSGFLSGKYRRGADLPSTARAGGVQKGYMTDRGFTVLEAIDKVAVTVNATPAQVALSWLAHRPGITAPIASATTVAQLHELIGGIELRLDQEATAALDKASAWREACPEPGYATAARPTGSGQRRE